MIEVFFFALAFSGALRLPNAQWVPFTPGFVVSLAGIGRILAKSLFADAFRKAAAITLFAFLMLRQALHSAEDICKICTKQTIHPVLLIVVSMISTVTLPHFCLRA